MTPENNTIEFKKPESAEAPAETCKGECGSCGCNSAPAEAPAAPKNYRLRELTEEEAKKFDEVRNRALGQLNAGIDNVTQNLVLPMFRALADNTGVTKSRLHLLTNIAYAAAGFHGPIDANSAQAVNDFVVDLAIKSGVVKGEPADDGSSDPFLVKWDELPVEQQAAVDLFYGQGIALGSFVQKSNQITNQQVTAYAHHLGFLEEVPAEAPAPVGDTAEPASAT